VKLFGLPLVLLGAGSVSALPLNSQHQTPKRGDGPGPAHGLCSFKLKLTEDLINHERKDPFKAKIQFHFKDNNNNPMNQGYLAPSTYPIDWPVNLIAGQPITLHGLINSDSSFEVRRDNPSSLLDRRNREVQEGFTFVYTLSVFNNKPLQIKSNDVDHPDTPFAQCTKDSMWTSDKDIVKELPNQWSSSVSCHFNC